MKFQLKLKALSIASFVVALSLMLSSCFEQEGKTDGAAIESQAEKYRLNTHYKKVENVVEDQSDKIEVTEFFWYGCPSCQEFEPALQKWKAALPDDVIIKQVPAIWNDVTHLHAQLFFIAKDLESFETVHERLFREVKALQGEKDLSIQTTQFAKVFSEFGVEESDFINQLSSSLAADKAKMLVDSVGILKVPTMMVNGEYYVITPSVKSHEDVLDVVDFLIEKTRGGR